MNNIVINGYSDWLDSLKKQITSARNKAALAINAELIRLDHQIGQELLLRQSQQNWGDKIIDRLGRDLKEVFPDMKGFSARNLKYMRYFAEDCP